jgi:hypothetical protein
VRRRAAIPDGRGSERIGGQRAADEERVSRDTDRVVIRTGRLSEGFAVEASLLARLLRLKLLRLEATILVVPADATGTLPSRSGPDPVRALSATGVPASRRGRLADARRCLDEGEALLARARRSRSLPQGAASRPPL